MIIMKAKMAKKEQKKIRDYSWWVCKQTSQRVHSKIPRSTRVEMETRLKFIFEQIGPVARTVDNFLRTGDNLSNGQPETFERMTIFFAWIAQFVRRDANFFAWIAQTVRTDANFLRMGITSRSNGCKLFRTVAWAVRADALSVWTANARHTNGYPCENGKP